MIQTTERKSKSTCLPFIVVDNARHCDTKDGIDTGVCDGSGIFSVTADRAKNFAIGARGWQAEFWNVKITATNPEGATKGYADWSDESLTVFARELLARDYTK